MLNPAHPILRNRFHRQRHEALAFGCVTLAHGLVLLFLSPASPTPWISATEKKAPLSVNWVVDPAHSSSPNAVSRRDPPFSPSTSPSRFERHARNDDVRTVPRTRSTTAVDSSIDAPTTSLASKAASPPHPIDQRADTTAASPAPVANDGTATPTAALNNISSEPPQGIDTPPSQDIPVSQLHCPTLAKPAYPDLSIAAGEQGTVWVRVWMDMHGSPRDVRLHRSSGFTRLDRAALQGAWQMRCEPFQDRGRAQAIWAMAPIAFELE